MSRATEEVRAGQSTPIIKKRKGNLLLRCSEESTSRTYVFPDSLWASRQGQRRGMGERHPGPRPPGLPVRGRGRAWGSATRHPLGLTSQAEMGRGGVPPDILCASRHGRRQGVGERHLGPRPPWAPVTGGGGSWGSDTQVHGLPSGRSSLPLTFPGPRSALRRTGRRVVFPRNRTPPPPHTHPAH